MSYKDLKAVDPKRTLHYTQAMSTKTQTAAASLGLVFTTLIWGFAFVIVKNSLDYVPPIYMLAFRFTIAALVLPFIFIKKIKKINWNYVLNGSLLGLFLFAAYAFQTIGCQYTTAGKNAFITTIYVILVPFLHWVFTKKKPDIYAVIAALLGITGIGLLSLQGDLSINKGDILTIICGLCYAIHIVFIARFTEHQDPVILTIIQLAAAAVFSWIFAPFYDGAFPLAALQNSSVVYSMLYLGLMSTMAAFLFQTVCQKYVPPSTAALLLSLEAVFGVFFAWLLLKEYLTPRMAVGCVLIFTAVVLAETHFDFLKRKSKKPSHYQSDKTLGSKLE